MKSKNDRRSFLKKIAIGGIGASTMPSAYSQLLDPLSIESMRNFSLMSENNDNEALSCWLESSLNRIFPQSPSKPTTQFDLIAARNSKISFQVGFRNNTVKFKKLECRLENTDHFKPSVRLVGLVPMSKFTPSTPPDELDGIGYLPGLCPDPLLEVNSLVADPLSSRSFWVTLNIPAEIEPGKYNINVELTWENIIFGMDKGEKGNISLPLINRTLSGRHDPAMSRC